MRDGQTLSFRTVYITKRSRCTYKSGYMVIREAEQTMVHLSEIDAVVVENTASFLSSYLLSELATAKIPVLVCDLQHNPAGQYLPLYGAHDSSGRVKEQISWDDEIKRALWARVVHSKIANQRRVLERCGCPESALLAEYEQQIMPGDTTNREGHAAKVYFNALFGKDFARSSECSVNAMLNYGYAVLLSWMNKEITARGYLTQLGISHCNVYNSFNLACDFMEPFRPVIDEFVLENVGLDLTTEVKARLLGLMYGYHQIDLGRYQLSSIISIYAKCNFAILSGRAELDSYLEFALDEE